MGIKRIPIRETSDDKVSAVAELQLELIEEEFDLLDSEFVPEEEEGEDPYEQFGGFEGFSAALDNHLQSLETGNYNDESTDYDASAFYDDLWTEILTTVDTYGASIQDENGVLPYETQPPNQNLHSDDTEVLEVAVSYGALDSLNYTTNDFGNTVQRCTTIYFLPAVSVSPVRFSNTHFIEIIPSAYAEPFLHENLSFPLRASFSQIIQLPVETHTLVLSRINTMLLALPENSNNNEIDNTSGRSWTISRNVLMRLFGSEVSRSPHNLSVCVRTESLRVGRSQPSITTLNGCSLPLPNFPASAGHVNITSSELNAPPSVESFCSTPSGVVSQSQLSSTTSTVSASNSSSATVLLNQTAVTPQRNLREHTSIRTTPVVKRNRHSAGRKRRRRHENDAFLTGLTSEESYEDTEVPSYSHFSSHLRDSDSIQIWRNFMHSPEELQNAMLNIAERREVSRKRNRNIRRRNHREEDQDPVCESRSDAAFWNLTREQRNIFLRDNIPYGMVVYLESLIVDHFTVSPDESLITPPLSSYERLIIHALSAYYSLNSHSVGEGARRQVVIHNRFAEFQRPELRIFNYVDVLRRRLQDQSHDSPSTSSE